MKRKSQEHGGYIPDFAIKAYMKGTPYKPDQYVAWDEHDADSTQLTPGSPEHCGAHVRLVELCQELETDFEPYGKRVRAGYNANDCSCGCRHYAVLAGPLGHDWGVCMNSRSPRAGLLTFEHQGCPKFEAGRPSEQS